jgi:hypothetical protein
MNIEQLRGLPRHEAIKRAAEWAGVGPEVIDGIWNTETKRGTHPTLIGPPTKWGEAKGHFQQLDYITETWSQRFGRKLDPMDFYDGLAMTAAQLKENMTRYGDVRKSVLAYHGGSNEKQWGPRTRSYADKVLGSAPQEAAMFDPMTASAASIKATYETRPAATEAVGGGSLRAASDFIGTPTAGYAPAAQAQRAAFEAADKQREEAEQKLADSTTFGDQVSASLRSAQTPAFRLISRLLGDAPERGERDEEWLQNYARNWTKLESGFSEAEREKLRDTINDKDYQRTVMDIMDERENQKTIGARGAGWAFAAQITGGLLDYQNYLVGYGVMKTMGVAGIGSARLISQGRAGAAAASVAAENVIGNVAYEAMLDALGEYRGTGDYALAAVTGLLPSAVFSTLAYRGATQQLVENAKAKVLTDVLENETRIATQAITNLGEGATPKALADEMRRIETAEIEARVRGALAQAADEDRIPAINLDEVAAEAAPTESAMRGVEAREVDPNEVDLSLFDAPSKDAGEYTNYGKRSYLGSVNDFVESYWNEPSGVQAARGQTVGFAEQYGVTVDHKDFTSTKGTRLDPSIEADPAYRKVAETIEKLRQQLMPEVGIYLTGTTPAANTRGLHVGVNERLSLIGLQKGSDIGLTATHEFGHAIIAHRLLKASPEVRQRMLDAFDAWSQQYSKRGPGEARVANLQRSPISGQMIRDSRVSDTLIDGDELTTSLRGLLSSSAGADYARYFGNFDEFSAEQFVKFVEDNVINPGSSKLTVPQQVMLAIKDMIKMFLSLFKEAKDDGLLAPSTAFKDFFDEILETVPGNVAPGVGKADGVMPTESAMAMPAGGFKGPQMTSPAAPRIAAADWQLATKYGLDKMPQTTPMEKAEFKAVLDIYRKAEVWAANNPVDEGRLNTLLNNSAFQSLTSTSMQLAMSQNPVARMVAGTLLENTTGAVGRRSTAALSKFMHEQTFIGNSINEFESAFSSWAKANGHSSVKAKVDNLVGGDLYPAFNKLVAEEIEARRGTGGKTNAHPAVQRAADAIEASYERMRVAQVQTKTVGFARLPESSRGYMTHVISKERLMTMTDSEQRAFINLLTEQFQQYEGFDLAFSQELARKYLDHARVNALGGHEIPANIHNPQSADMVRGALEAMGMNREQVNLMMTKYSAGGPSHTKKRLDLNLNQPYPDGMGGEVRLLDLFETDQLQILRNYSRRVSGEVALAQHGVMGSQGLALLRRALMFGDHGPRVEQPRVMEAFDQVGAEFLGRPFGDNNNKWLDRAMTANAAARLGGMVFNQVGEAINMFVHLGVGHAFSGIASMPRLRGELIAAAKGQPVKNGILSSLEQWGGTGEFGSEGYKLVMPFDEPNSAYRSYGADTVTTLDRVLRSASHAQGVLSGWRMVHAAQTRAAAEQIVLKSVRYVRDGIEDAALRDMGITPQMAARIKKELPNVATFDPAGRVQTLDFTKAQDQELARDWAQVVLRGSRQIIQGTFIGETGKWAHDGWLKLLTQFRTFSLTSMEKQWARGRENAGGGFKGTFAMLGIMTGAMAAAFPIYYARVMVAAQGRPDREEYIRERLEPGAVARATLNYIPMSGLLGDFLDASSAVGGGIYEGITDEKLPTWAQPSGGRAGSGQDFVGGVVAPSVSYVDDAYKALQDLDNPHKAVQMLPGSRIWWLQPAINGLRPE